MSSSNSDLTESLLFFNKANAILGSLGDGRKSEYQAKLASNEASVLMSMGNLDEARKKIENALGKLPSLTAALTNLGIILYRGGDPASAIPYLRRALSNNPTLIQAKYFLVLALYANHQTLDAKHEVEGLIPYLRGLLASAPTSGAVPKDCSWNLSLAKGPTLSLGYSFDSEDLQLLSTYFARQQIQDGIKLLRNYVDTNRCLTEVFSTMNPQATYFHMDRAADGALHLAELYSIAGEANKAGEIWYSSSKDRTTDLSVYRRLIELDEQEKKTDELYVTLVRYVRAIIAISR